MADPKTKSAVVVANNALCSVVFYCAGIIGSAFVCQ